MKELRTTLMSVNTEYESENIPHKLYIRELLNELQWHLTARR